MTIQDGQFIEDSVELLLDAMVADFEAYVGEELPPQKRSSIRAIYRPVAKKLHEAQSKAGLVLSSSQLAYAEDTALDLLTGLIGVVRRPASTADGEVTFSRSSSASTDYTIPRGTEITTENGLEPVSFKTTETVTLTSGSSSVVAPVVALEAGPDGNVASNTITRMPNEPVGVDSVTNNNPTTGGRREENDSELRERAQEELAEGSAATAAALVSACKNVPDTRSVSIYINDSDTDNTGSGGLPAHSFELVVEGGTDQEVADAIMGTKAAAGTSWYGVNGNQASATVEILNGQTFDVYFSRPSQETITVDATLETTSEYEGDEAVRNAVVAYIGGVRPSGNTDDGELQAGDDVIYNSVLSAIMDVPGVDDVSTLYVDDSGTTDNTSNLAMSRTTVATTDATVGDITLTTS